MASGEWRVFYRRTARSDGPCLVGSCLRRPGVGFEGVQGFEAASGVLEDGEDGRAAVGDQEVLKVGVVGFQFLQEMDEFGFHGVDFLNHRDTEGTELGKRNGLAAPKARSQSGLFPFGEVLDLFSQGGMGFFEAFEERRVVLADFVGVVFGQAVLGLVESDLDADERAVDFGEGVRFLGFNRRARKFG